MAITLPENATIINDGRWPYLSANRTGNTMDQYMAMARIAATNIRLLFVNNSATSITYEVSACKGWRTADNPPVRVTFGGSNSVTIGAYGYALSDELSNVTSLDPSDFVLTRVFLAESRTITGGVQASITHNPINSTVVPVNAFGQRATNYRATVANSDALTSTSDTYEQSFANNGAHQGSLITPVAIIGIPVDPDGPRNVVFVGDSKSTNLLAVGYQSGGNEETTFGSMFPITFGPSWKPRRAYFQWTWPSQSALTIIGSGAQKQLMRDLLTIPSGHNKPPIFVYRLGTNSLGNTPNIASGVAAEFGYIQTMLGWMLSGTKCVVSTLDPVASLVSGTWATATEANQANGGNFSNGVDIMNVFNETILSPSRPAFIDVVADCASVVRTANGFWRPNTTSDGIHQTNPVTLYQSQELYEGVEYAQYLIDNPETPAAAASLSLAKQFAVHSGYEVTHL